MALSPPQMWMFLKQCREAGVLPYVNTLNHNLQAQISGEVEARAKADKSLDGPFLVKKARGAGIFETFDLHTTLRLAKELDLPEIAIAHVTSGESVELFRHYRREHRLNVHGESGSAWLTLWWPEVGERLGYMATCIQPQISDAADVDMLWDGIRTGEITCAGTDGVISPTERYPDGTPNPLYRPTPTKDRQGFGFPSHICHFPTVLNEGLARAFSPVEIAEICAFNPAKLMRLYPKKGTIAVGSDADLVIMEIGKPHTVRKAELNTTAPFNPWEDFVLNCWPVLTMLRGQVIFAGGKQTTRNMGKYLPRYPG
jgi:dihydroorotase-like cyclic amidohydrolase